MRPLHSDCNALEHVADAESERAGAGERWLRREEERGIARFTRISSRRAPSGSCACGTSCG